MKYNSTRDKNVSKYASECILQGISAEGGLYVPSELESIHFDIEEFIGKDYRYIAKHVLSSFFTDFSDKQIDYCVTNAYSASNFSSEDIFNVKTFSDFSVLELTSGKTCAFKDAALSILPYLMHCAKENAKDDRKTVILTATSGDTGKAAMEGFSNVHDTEVFVFYPYKGVSALQLKQMLTSQGENVHAYAVKGNFDDAQTAVKRAFNNIQFQKEIAAKGAELSSANSINIGRLIPQIVYYYHSYTKLVQNGTIKIGDKINFCVPTGNFGNILAGYYAYKTGLPVNKFICASNSNNVLTDFFRTKKYDRNRAFKQTISPSMDILISSNLERLIYEINGKDDVKTSKCMQLLQNDGHYLVQDSGILEQFYAAYATEDDIRAAIAKVYADYSYLIDTHTAAGYHALEQYKHDTNDTSHTMLLSTASPYKFPSDVMHALTGTLENNAENAVLALNNYTKAPVPKPLSELSELKMKNEEVISTFDIENTVLKKI